MVIDVGRTGGTPEFGLHDAGRDTAQKTMLMTTVYVLCEFLLSTIGIAGRAPDYIGLTPHVHPRLTCADRRPTEDRRWGDPTHSDEERRRLSRSAGTRLSKRGYHGGVASRRRR